ncbi:MAG: bestrophin family ion channel [Mycobacterium sp.]
MRAPLVGQVLRRFRFDAPAILAVAAVMAVAVDRLGLQSVSAVVPLMGIVVAIFIGFRNRNAYNRWWEARTLWGAVVINARSLHYALLAYEDGTPEMAAITDRMRNREVCHARRLAAELRGRPPGDPAEATATELLSRQAADIGELSRAGLIDRQARRVLVTINSAQANTAAGLERIVQQPVPRFYDVFTRGLAWFFAVIVCTRMDSGGHGNVIGIVLGVLIMTLVILAERLGCLLEEPMSDDVFGLPLDRFCAQLATDLSSPARA